MALDRLNSHMSFNLLKKGYQEARFFFFFFKQAKHTKNLWEKIGFKTILQTFLLLKIYLKTSSKIDHKRAVLQKVGVFGGFFWFSFVVVVFSF